MNGQENKRVGIWIRVSTEDQAQGDSPEHHRERAKYYAKSKGWAVVEIYDLSGVSGKSVIDHPEAKRMLSDIRSGHISGLIFSKLARLARNTKELLSIAEIFQEVGADLISLSEAIDTSTPAGRLFFTMVAAMAQWEREEIASRVAASVPVRAKLGKPLGGAAPFGYQWKDKELIPDPQEAPVRKHLYEVFHAERRLKTTARILNEQGYRTRKGAKFSDTTIERLLRDPTAKGMRRANYTRSTGEGKQWALKPEHEWVHIPVEPIVSEELWNECNAILDQNKKPRKRPGRKSVHPFAGRVICCHCKTPMYVPSNSPKYTCRKCRQKIPTDDLEQVFREQLKHTFLSSNYLDRARDDANADIKEKMERLELLKTERSRLQKKIDKLYELYTDEAISKEAFTRQYKPYEEQAAQLDDEIPQLQAEIDCKRVDAYSKDQIMSDAQDLYDRWETLSSEEKQVIVETMVERISICDEEITIDFTYRPDSSQIMATGQHMVRDSWRPQAGNGREIRPDGRRGRW